MLKSLFIKDYALIEQIEMEFGKGLNIITGETGAGKSIIIDAMSLLLGERASADVIRKGADKSIVEGIFEYTGSKKLKEIFARLEIEENNELIIRREISSKGTNRCFLNDTPVTLSIIKEVGDYLVDLHGQHEHQSLLKPETHIELVDEIGQYGNLLDQFKLNFDSLERFTSELNSILDKEKSIKEKKDLYEFQIKEIDEISPMENEDETLLEELNILENSEKLLALTSETYDWLYEGENSIIDQIAKVNSILSELMLIDKSFAEKQSELESVSVILSDIARFLRNYKERIDLQPEKLNEIRDRLGAINLLKKKYGGSISKLLEHRRKIGAEFELAENFADRIREQEEKINVLRIECGHIAKKISAERKSLSKKIKKEIEAELKNLGMPEAQFQVNIKQERAAGKNFIIVDGEPFSFNERGIDFVEFYISTNAGEDTKPLAKIASGGEVSRVMLALKSILAKSDRLPILIFDEIDTGVSGRIAQKVGQSLKSLAAIHQIIAITHLPQIAGLSNFHYSVEKKKIGERVVSTIRLLNDEEKVSEVAKLISGEKITEAALKGARELINAG